MPCRYPEYAGRSSYRVCHQERRSPARGRRRQQNGQPVEDRIEESMRIPGAAGTEAVIGAPIDKLTPYGADGRSQTRRRTDQQTEREPAGALEGCSPRKHFAPVLEQSYRKFPAGLNRHSFRDRAGSHKAHPPMTVERKTKDVFAYACCALPFSIHALAVLRRDRPPSSWRRDNNRRINALHPPSVSSRTG